VAFKIGSHTADPLQMYLTDIMTVAANLAGVPSVSVPCGEADGLPVGLQIMAAQHNDRALLGAAKAYEELRL
jgi:aspartyl-tRNA(Asn)/glutamyl-tRNA(Gln) amidotransferase subunit A